jgi:hypothetical protein
MEFDKGNGIKTEHQEIELDEKPVELKLNTTVVPEGVHEPIEVLRTSATEVAETKEPRPTV